MESNVNVKFNLLDANLDNITDDLGGDPLPLPSARVTPEDEYDDDDIWGGEGVDDDEDEEEYE